MTNPALRQLSSERPTLLSDPAGHLCDACQEREAAMIWGAAMTVNHGGGQWRCEICAVTEQLAYARERAAAIPDLEAQLDAAWDKIGERPPEVFEVGDRVQVYNPRPGSIGTVLKVENDGRVLVGFDDNQGYPIVKLLRKIGRADG